MRRFITGTTTTYIRHYDDDADDDDTTIVRPSSERYRSTCRYVHTHIHMFLGGGIAARISRLHIFCVHFSTRARVNMPVSKQAPSPRKRRRADTSSCPHQRRRALMFLACAGPPTLRWSACRPPCLGAPTLIAGPARACCRRRVGGRPVACAATPACARAAPNALRHYFSASSREGEG